MKKIILMRHAKVALENETKIDSFALQEWVDKYDHAPIDSQSLPSTQAMTLAQSADIVLTSTLRRAKDSAKVLNLSVHEASALFNEALIPKANIPLIKFKPRTWLVILRLMLLLGLGKKETSLKASKKQADQAAQKLLEHLKEYDTVFLVAHGGMNWLIRKELQKKGWKIEGRPSNANWGVTVLSSEYSFV